MNSYIYAYFRFDLKATPPYQKPVHLGFFHSFKKEKKKIVMAYAKFLILSRFIVYSSRNKKR